MKGTVEKLVSKSLPVILAMIAVGAGAGARGEVRDRHEIVNIAQVTHEPAFEDFLNMEAPRYGAEMTRIEGLVQRTPKDGALVSERTVVYLGYDDKNIYAIFLCFDRTPEKIRARMTGRDNFPNDDDAVALQLDTFHDRMHAYGFEINARGVQIDGIWTEGQGWDLSYDTIWYSRAQITPKGYVAMISVPFKSVRFRPGEKQSWGMMLWRGIPRNSEDAYWPGYSARIEGRLSQAADVRGLERIAPGRGMQFIPYVSLLSARDIDTRDANAPKFSGKSAHISGGLDAKLVMRKSLVLDTTINPDFSQVESDQPQVTVNQRFEVLFPEKRPFFLENASYFSSPVAPPLPSSLVSPIDALSPLSLLFTRRIVDPQFGARLSGRMGPYAVGALVVDDRSPGEVVPEGNALAGKRALFSAVSVARDVGKGSTIGILYSGRRFESGSNYVGGLDGRLRLNSNWVVTFLAAKSTNSYSTGSEQKGSAYEATLDRSGRQLSYQLQFDDRSAGFRAEAGYVNRVDIRQVAQTVSYRFRPEGRHLIAWGPDVSSTGIWDHQGTFVGGSVTPVFNVELSRQSKLAFFYSLRQETLRPSDFATLTRNETFGEGIRGFSLATSLIRQVTLSTQYSIGKSINFAPPTHTAPFAADETALDWTLSLHPKASLSVDNTYLLTRLSDPRSGATVFNNHILRSKWNYQFTRALSLRAILEYDATLASQQLSSLQTSKHFDGDLLLTFLPHPGTAFYLGYNSSLSNIDPALVATSSGLLRRNGPFINDGRQIFVKFSYLFRY